MKQTTTQGLGPSKTTIRARLMASSMITGVALAAATGAYAQSTPATPGASTQASEVVVTGTRLRSPNLTSISPVTAVSQQDFKLQGANDTIDVLNTLPQTSMGGNSLNNTPNPLSGSGGFTTVNLRDLGTVRTLVLEDGKRMMPGDPTLGGEAADLDQIPSALIERVDILTGGASSVYGSDAVAGVVNFIMKHNFQGVEADAQYGFNEHSNSDTMMQGLEKAFGVPAPSGSLVDGRSFTSTLTFGSNTADDKGNVTGYVSYRHADPVTEGSRDYSACQLVQAVGTPACHGSSNSNFFDDQYSGQVYSVTGTSPNNILTTTRNQSTSPPAKFNSNPYEYLSRGDERYLGGFFAHYDVNPALQFYSDFSFMDDRTRIDAGPSALFQQIFNVNCNNPELSAQQRGVLQTGDFAADGVTPLTCANDPAANAQASLSIGRRNIEGGPRIYSYEHESFKIDAGARGDFADTWHYDIYAQFGRTAYNQSVQNDISLTKAQNALLVNPTTGQCQSIATNPTCVPYNIFSTGGVSTAAVQYIETSGSTAGDTQEQIVHGDVSGNLDKFGLKSPWANSGLAVSVGFEYRREALDETPDETSLSGDLAGAGGASPPVHGSFDVKEIFAEVGVPLINDKPFIKDLSLAAGYRYSDYSLSGDVEAWKLGLEWSPVSDIRFRGSYNRAVRAPNVQELFAPQQITNTSVVASDPCSAAGTGGAATASLAACERTGVTAAQYGNGIDPAVGGTDKISQCPGGQCGTVLGGNSKLTPEISNTYSGGVVIAPRFIPGLNFSADYFNIDVDNAIATLPINIAFNDCLNSGTYCNLVVRQSNGSLFGSNINLGGYISGTNLNIGRLQTEGVDFSMNYRLDLDVLGLHDKGALQFKFNGTWTSHLTTEPIPGQGTYNCAGLYGNTCGVPTPNWRHVFRVTWVSPWQFSLSAQWRYLGGSQYDGNQSNPLLYEGPFGASATDVNDAKIGAYSYLDLATTWKVKPGLMLRAGVNNVLDKNPPTLDNTYGITPSGAPNTFNNYDLLGRQLFFGLTADF